MLFDGLNRSAYSKCPVRLSLSLIMLSVEIIETVLPVLDAHLESSPKLTEEIAWKVADEVTDTLRLRARSEVMKPMRHALTGRIVWHHLCCWLTS